MRLGYTPLSPSVTLILSPSLRVWAPQMLGLAAGACCSRSAHPALHPGLQPRSPPSPKLPCSRVSFLPSIRPSFPLVRTSRPLPLPAPFSLLFSCPKPCREAPLVTQLNNWCAPPTSLSVGDFRDWTQTHSQPLTCTLDIHYGSHAHSFIHSLLRLRESCRMREQRTRPPHCPWSPAHPRARPPDALDRTPGHSGAPSLTAARGAQKGSGCRSSVLEEGSGPSPARAHAFEHTSSLRSLNLSSKPLSEPKEGKPGLASPGTVKREDGLRRTLGTSQNAWDS